MDALRFQALARQAKMIWPGASPPPLPSTWARLWPCGGGTPWPSSPPRRGRCRRWPGSAKPATWPSKTWPTPRGWAYANEALDLARRLGRPDELGIAVSAYQWSAGVVDHLPALRTVLDEMLLSRWPDLTPPAQGIVLARALLERIRSWDLDLFCAELERAWGLATEVLHSPEVQVQLRVIEACRYFVGGDVERGAALLGPALQTMLDLGTTWREPGQFVVGSCQMLVSGTLADHADEIAAPPGPARPPVRPPPGRPGRRPRVRPARRPRAGPPHRQPLVRAAAALVDVVPGGRLLGPRRHRTGAPAPAWLYDQLAPHAGELAVVGHVGDCGGAVDSLLAGLLWRLGRLDEATEGAQAGLELEARVGPQIWVKRTSDLIDRIHSSKQSSP